MYTIITMQRHELDTALKWAQAEGWNPGLHDADCFYRADPNGFFIGLLNGEPIAVISAIRYDKSFGFIGFFIVKPEHRGKGYGLQIWNAALKYLKGCTIGLDGVNTQQNNYRKSGFVLAHNNLRYKGTGGGTAPNNLAIVPLSTLSFEAIENYDRPFFPAGRKPFLQHWITQPQSISLGVLNAGVLAGYGVMRVCHDGFKIGPLFADNANDAEQIFATLKSHAPENAPVFLDTPAKNPAALKLAKRHGMQVSFETARMYIGPPPQLPLPRLYGITTFELG